MKIHSADKAHVLCNDVQKYLRGFRQCGT